MEFVFVVPRRQLFVDRYPQGFVPFRSRDAEPSSSSLAAFESACERHGFFVERRHAETNPDLKQIIPYAVVMRGGEVLLMRRLARGGEQRLHDKLSIGVGGHINPVDVELGEGEAPQHSPIRQGTIRELHEELRLEGDFTLQSVGIINDDSNAVGAVHVGLVQLVETTGSVTIREEDTLQGSFVPPAELARRLREGADFETWSGRLVDHLDEIVPARQREALGTLA